MQHCEMGHKPADQVMLNMRMLAFQGVLMLRRGHNGQQLSAENLVTSHSDEQHKCNHKTRKSMKSIRNETIPSQHEKQHQSYVYGPRLP